MLDVADHVAGTFLEDAPVVPVSRGDRHRSRRSFVVPSTTLVSARGRRRRSRPASSLDRSRLRRQGQRNGGDGHAHRRRGHRRRPSRRRAGPPAGTCAGDRARGAGDGRDRARPAGGAQPGVDRPPWRAPGRRRGRARQVAADRPLRRVVLRPRFTRPRRVETGGVSRLCGGRRAQRLGAHPRRRRAAPRHDRCRTRPPARGVAVAAWGSLHHS